MFLHHLGRSRGGVGLNHLAEFAGLSSKTPRRVVLPPVYVQSRVPHSYSYIAYNEPLDKPVVRRIRAFKKPTSVWGLGD